MSKTEICHWTKWWLVLAPLEEWCRKIQCIQQGEFRAAHTRVYMCTYIVRSQTQVGMSCAASGVI